MDLFEDLPEPSEVEKSKSETTTGVIKVQPTGEAPVQAKMDFRLSDGDSAWSGTRGKITTQNKGMGLFDDLPPNNSSVEGMAEKDTDGGDIERGKKRKLDETEKNHTRGSCVQDSTNVESVVKMLKGSLLELKGFVSDRKGEREDMQDAHCITEDLLPEIGPVHSSISRVSYFAVFDGHGGERASKYAASHLHKNIAKKFPKGDINQIEKDIKRQLIEAFKKTNEDFLKLATASKPSWKDGTTAVAVLVINNTLYIANLGDSKAILCRYSEEKKDFLAVPLTKDHSPTQYEERMRIQKAGGNVKDGRVMGILEVSRSLGDGPYKAHGVTCIPDVKRCQLSSNDRYILIACDGLWKTFKSEESVSFVNKILELDRNNGTDKTGCSEQFLSNMESACSRVANEAVRKLSADNVTVMLVAVQVPSSIT